MSFNLDTVSTGSALNNVGTVKKEQKNLNNPVFFKIKTPPKIPYDAVVITCFDPRFSKEISKHLEDKLKIYNYDLISTAGGVKNIVDGTDSSIMKSIAVASKSHGVRKVVIFGHSDCLGYGGRCNFNDHDHEFDAHKQDLLNAEKIIQTKFPEITTIISLFISFEEIGDEMMGVISTVSNKG